MLNPNCIDGGHVCTSQLVLSRTDFEIEKDSIEWGKINYWDSESNDSSPSSASRKARGVLISGLAGAALPGPVGAAIGAAWAGSEESAGQIQSDLIFTVEGENNNEEAKIYKIRFENPTTARRFRMELPMFTGLRASRKRNPVSGLQQNIKKNNQNCWSDFKRTNTDIAS